MPLTYFKPHSCFSRLGIYIAMLIILSSTKFMLKYPQILILGVYYLIRFISLFINVLDIIISFFIFILFLFYYIKSA